MNSKMIKNYDPIPWEKLTKIEGPIKRHIEQLWDEIEKLKKKIEELEKNK